MSYKRTIETLFIYSMKKFLLGTLLGTLLATSSLALASYGNAFTDIAADSWYTEAANDLYTRDVLTGYSDGTLRPSTNINRAETAVMMSRLMENIDLNFEPFPQSEENSNAGNYYICQAVDGQADIENQERIYMQTSASPSQCDQNNCTINFYDNQGESITTTGPGSQDPGVQTENCIATSSEYFNEKVND